MTRLEILTDLLSKKIERQAVLKERNEVLKNLEEELDGARFGRWFGSSYQKIKRLLFLSFGVVFLVGFLWVSLFPESITEDRELREMTLMEEIEEAEQLSGRRIYIYDMSDHEDFLDGIMNDMKLAIQYGLLIISLICLYTSRQIKKVIVRNRRLSEAEDVTKDVIYNYQTTIDEEEEELVVLNELVRKNMVFNHTNT